MSGGGHNYHKLHGLDYVGRNVTVCCLGGCRDRIAAQRQVIVAEVFETFVIPSAKLSALK